MAGIINRILLPVFLVALCAAAFFHGAFSIVFFADDYQFLNLGSRFSLSFFLPGKEHFYRPLSTEVFYFVIQQLPNPALAGHVFSFSVFAIGIVFLYKTVRIVTRSRQFAVVVAALYLVHFSHVYQLYWLATFQEILMTTALILASYAALRKRFIVSTICVIVALLSKETAAVYPLLVGLVLIVVPSLRTRTSLIYWLSLIVLTAGAVLLYASGIQQNEAREAAYQFQPNPALAVNNGIWYTLWSLGLPHNLPDYMPSLIGLPLPRFYEFLTHFEFRWYLILLGAYLSILAGMTVTMIVRLLMELSRHTKKQHKKGKPLLRWRTYLPYLKRVLPGVVIAGGIVILFLLPYLFIQHKWMVRLTVPLIGIVTMQAAVFWYFLQQGRWGQALVGVMLMLYTSWNYLGVQVHEEISTYNLESRIVRQSTEYFSTLAPLLKHGDVLYFVDGPDTNMSAWDGAQKLKVTFSDQAFLFYYFNGLELYARYQGDEGKGDLPKKIDLPNIARKSGQQDPEGRIFLINSNSLIPE